MDEVPTRCVALVERWPTEAEARQALATDLAPGVPLGRYLGVWRYPVEGGPLVHLFTDVEPEWLERSGWVRHG